MGRICRMNRIDRSSGMFRKDRMCRILRSHRMGRVLRKLRMLRICRSHRSCRFRNLQDPRLGGAVRWVGG